MYGCDTPSQIPESDGVLELADDARQELDRLVCHCIEYLTGASHIVQVKYPDQRTYHSSCVERKVRKGGKEMKNKGRVWSEQTRKAIEECNEIKQRYIAGNRIAGNLYALHVRCRGSEDWRLKYVGKCRDPQRAHGRLKEHLVDASPGTASMLWHIAHALIGGCEIGFSIGMAKSGPSSAKALAGYVEERIIEWRCEDRQKSLWGEPWNIRSG